MTETYDLIAIGTGSAASVAAYTCRKQGWRVAVVDSRPFGGTCALRGCDPKKVLVGAADALEQTRRMYGSGLAADGLRIEWSELMAFKRSFTQPVPEDREKAFRRAGVDTLHGRARFTGATSLEVAGETFETGKVLVATGAKPRPLSLRGEEHVTTSTEFLELDELPRRIVFVGGGYISFEFAHLAVRAGSQVTILHRSDRVLKNFEPDLVDRLVEATRDAGIDVRTRAPVVQVEQAHEGLRVHTERGVDPVECDLVIHGAGRVPEIEDLDLDAASVAHDDRGVHVNQYLQSTTNPDVYAAGDAAATDGWPLTPVASAEGHVAAANMLRGNERAADFTGTASVVFTIPPLARVGLTEEEARAENLAFAIQQGDMDEWYSYRHLRSRPAAYKVLVEEGSGHILGAHLLGDRAEETINLFALAVRHQIPVGELRRVPWAYPTHGSDLPYMV